MFRSGYSISRTIALCALLFLCAQAGLSSRPDEIPFEKHTIDLGASETAVFADINRDGKLDLVSGEYWYEAPRWTKHRFRELSHQQLRRRSVDAAPGCGWGRLCGPGHVRMV